MKVYPIFSRLLLPSFSILAYVIYDGAVGAGEIGETGVLTFSHTSIAHIDILFTSGFHDAALQCATISGCARSYHGETLVSTAGDSLMNFDCIADVGSRDLLILKLILVLRQLWSSSSCCSWYIL